MAPAQWQSDAAAARRAARRAIIVAGPTCSGKSALALHLAQRFGGTVINADAMQVYRELRILTARPTPQHEAMVPHALYGVRAAAEPGSVAWWRSAALAAMERAAVPILCGGSGLYLRALTAGLADIPDPGAAAREEARQLLATEGAPAMHARLLALDPATARGLRPHDGQRVARAWEVRRGTGRGLAEWLAAPPAPSGWEFTVVRLDPDRAELRAAITSRFTAMLAAGAVAEAAALASQGLDPALPAMRALGMPDLLAFLRGEITLAEAERRAVLATGQYTKRQATWFAHQTLAPAAQTSIIPSRYMHSTQLSETLIAGMQQFLCLPG